MERKSWREQQTQKCALTSIGLLLEGLTLPTILLKTPFLASRRYDWASERKSVNIRASLATNLLTDQLLCADTVAELSITSKFRKRMICVCSRSCSGVASVFFTRSASRADKTRKATSRST